MQNTLILYNYSWYTCITSFIQKNFCSSTSLLRIHPLINSCTKTLLTNFKINLFSHTVFLNMVCLQVQLYYNYHYYYIFWFTAYTIRDRARSLNRDELTYMNVICAYETCWLTSSASEHFRHLLLHLRSFFYISTTNWLLLL